jgi:hypothetical protein
MKNIYCWYISLFDTGFFVDWVWQVLPMIFKLIIPTDYLNIL